MRWLAITALIVLGPSAASAQPKPGGAARRQASAHYKQGKAFFDEGEYDKAISEFRAAYDIAPANPLLFSIARSLHLAGNKHEAVDGYRRYLAVEPTGALADEARVYVAELMKELDTEAAVEAQKRDQAEAERAREQQQEAARVVRERAQAHVAQARAYADAGNPSGAANEYAAAFEADRDPEHLFVAAETVHVDTALYQRYLAAAPTGPHADAARRAIAALTAPAAPIAVTHVEAPPPPPIEEPPIPIPTEFTDTRFAIIAGLPGSYSATNNVAGGSVGSAWMARLDHMWSNDMPGTMWSLGLDLDVIGTDLAHPRSTLYAGAANVGFGYALAFRPRLQLELVPHAEFVAVAIDHPFSSAIAWGNGGGVGARLALTYTFVSGLQVGLVAVYSLRWVSLAGDCTGCATGMPFSADVTMQLATVGISLGKRSR